MSPGAGRMAEEAILLSDAVGRMPAKVNMGVQKNHDPDRRAPVTTRAPKKFIRPKGPNNKD